MVTHTCNLSIWESEAGGLLKVQGWLTCATQQLPDQPVSKQNKSNDNKENKTKPKQMRIHTPEKSRKNAVLLIQ